MGQLQGKTALIAGAGRNNGKAIALAFAREGADLILLARERKAELDHFAHECEQLGAKVLPLLADVSDHEQVNRVVPAPAKYDTNDVAPCPIRIESRKAKSAAEVRAVSRWSLCGQEMLIAL